MAVVAEFGAVWSQQTFALEFIVDGRGWILTLGHFTGRGATSGVEAQTAFAQVIDFRDASRNRFLAVRELWVRGMLSPHYRRRADYG